MLTKDGEFFRALQQDISPTKTARLLLNGPANWQNPINRHDTNNNGITVEPIGVILAQITKANRLSGGQGESSDISTATVPLILFASPYITSPSDLRAQTSSTIRSASADNKPHDNGDLNRQRPAQPTSDLRPTTRAIDQLFSSYHAEDELLERAHRHSRATPRSTIGGCERIKCRIPATLSVMIADTELQFPTLVVDDANAPQLQNAKLRDVTLKTDGNIVVTRVVRSG